MTVRKTSMYLITAGALMAASVPALAHHRDWHGGGNGHQGRDRVVVHQRPAAVDRHMVNRHEVNRHVVNRRVVVQQPVYVDRPNVFYDRDRGDGGYGGYGGYDGYGGYVQPAPVYYEPPIYSAPVAYPQPYYPQAVYEPVYRESRINPIGAAAGAAVGAVIGHQVGDYQSRPVTTAVGAAIGGLLGSQF